MPQITVDVVVGGVKLVEDVDYVVSDNLVTDAGNYTLTFTGKGNYGGFVDVNFSVVCCRRYCF